MEIQPDPPPSFFSSASCWLPEWLPETSAWMAHAPFAFWLIEQLRPRTLVELGTHNGYSYMAFCQAIQKMGWETKCAAVDTWLGDEQAGFYEGNIFESLSQYNDEKYSAFSRLLRSTFDEALPFFTSKSVDLLHIDGLHTYEAVKHDFDTWLPTVSERGVVLFHDTHVRENNFGVWRLWADLKGKYPHFEFHHGYGLGILGVGSDLPASLRALFSVTSTQAAEIRAVYARLGHSLQPVVAPIPAALDPKDKTAVELGALKRKLRKLHVTHAAVLQKALEKEKHLFKQVEALKKIIQSAQDWQRRSWLKRAFHRWRAPSLPQKKILLSTPPAQPTPTTRPDPISTVFHPAYYQSTWPRVAESGLSPLEHYRTIGWKNGYKPHPLFDPAWYLQQNPHVSGEPLQHYLEIGWREGRRPHPNFDPVFYSKKHALTLKKDGEPLGHYLQKGWKNDFSYNTSGQFDWQMEIPHLEAEFSPEERQSLLGADFETFRANADPKRPVILLVTHESSRTGAPIILLNLAKYLRPRYHIIVFDLREGSLQGAFREIADYYLGFGTREQPRTNRILISLRLILAVSPIHFALVNSMASMKTLPVLAKRNVPTVFLVHEYATTFQKRASWGSTLSLTGKVIFPAESVRESSLEICPDLRMDNTRILPQGICPIVTPANADEIERLRHALRPPGWENAVLILGIGTVNYRKGVDLFFNCAAHLLRNNPPGTLRFVWIGGGYQPTPGNPFCSYLKEQMSKIIPENGVLLMEEIADAGPALVAADLLLLSSRRDPFPLIAQEAMAHSLPVICFDKATGIADLLKTEPLLAECVVPHADLVLACRQLQRLVDDPSLRQGTGEQARRMAEEIFRFEPYAKEVESLALQQVAETDGEIEDVVYIQSSGVFDASFARSLASPEKWARPIWWYVRAWASGIGRRRPFPGLHPGIYAEENGVKRGDPLVHYLKAGRPEGRWSSQVIEPLEATAMHPTATVKIALHIHLFYADMADSLVLRLKKNRMPVDLWITVPDAETEDVARMAFSSVGAGRIEIIQVPNSGRDIGAFLTGVGTKNLNGYDIVGHLHTKKSLHYKHADHIEYWTEFLLENHLGGRHAMMDATLSAMMADPSLGIVFPDNPTIFCWGPNRSFAETLVARMGDSYALPAEINFPVGTFFWARPAALKKIFDLNLGWEDYPIEPTPLDGTILHALERLLPLISEAAGFRTAVTHVPGITR